MKTSPAAEQLSLEEHAGASNTTVRPRFDTIARAVIGHCVKVINDDHATGQELAELEGWLARLEDLSAEEILRFVPAEKNNSYVHPRRISEFHARQVYEWWDVVIAERNAAASGQSL